MEVSPPDDLEGLIELALSASTSMQSLTEYAENEARLGEVYLRAAGRKASNLAQAIVAIGLEEARNLAFSYAVFTTMPEALTESSHQLLLEGCLRRAVIARQIAEERGDTNVYPAFAAGLMMETGLAWMAEGHDHLASSLGGLLRHPGGERVEAEKLLIGIDHPQAAADSVLGESLPADLRRAVLVHHEPDVDDPMVPVLIAAERVAELAVVSAPRNWLDATEKAVQASGARSSVQGLLQKAAEDLLRLAKALQLTVGRQPDPNVLLAERSTASLQQRANPMRTASNDDSPLARLTNRAQFREMLDGLVTRSNEPISMIVLNFDKFRKINETYGVPAGDKVMNAMVEALYGCLRASDTLARFGGDNYAILLPRAGSTGGQVVAERIRSAVEKTRIHLGDSRMDCSVTVFGMSFMPTDGMSVDELLQSLEDGLTEARTSSRNRVSWQSNEEDTLLS
ncbi:MAG: diguanylate cyclase [Myxococcota bacterium]